MASPSLAARAAILGVPYQPGKQPDPLGVVKAIEALDAKAMATSAGAIVRETLVDLSAVANPPSHQMGWVTGDATTANNGIYENAGSPSAPNWQRRADLPFGLIHMINNGAGTSDAIIATSALPLPSAPGAALLTVNIVADNIGPVTINDKPLRTNTGNEIIAGGIVAGSICIFVDQGNEYRLLSDQASAAIQAGAELAQIAAEDAADRAENAAAGVEYPVSYAPQILDPAEQDQARQNVGLKALAVKDKIEVSDVDANGTPGGTTYLRGDGAWAEPSAGGGSGLPNVVFPEDHGAVGDGVTNDGPAINAAIAAAGVGGIVYFSPKVYATEETIFATNSAGGNGLYLVGRQSGATFSVAPTTEQGTVLKWTGPAGGTLLFFGRFSDDAGDFSGGGMSGIQFDGNSLAQICVHFRSCTFSTFEQLRAFNVRNDAGAACFYLDSGAQAWAGVNSIYRCNWHNTALVAGPGLGMCLRLTGAPDETTGRHPAFVTFSGLHLTHDDGDALYIDSADDILFSDVGVSKNAGGAGRSVALIPSAGRSVVGLTFSQIHLGTNDAPTFLADGGAVGSHCRGIAIYGLQGVDHAPVVSAINGAEIDRIDYLGTVYSGGATRGSYTKVSPLRLTSFTVSELATIPSPAAGTVVHTWDGGGGTQCLAFFDGSSWRRVHSPTTNVSAT